MAEGKKGFILYADQKEVFEQLSDIKAGILIKHIFRYVNDEDPQTKDIVINLAFTPIKQQLKRDLKKWEVLKTDRSKAGQLGNLKRYCPDIYEQLINEEITLEQAQKLAKTRKPRKATQSDTKLAVNDNVTVTVNDIDNGRDITVLNAFKENVVKEAKELNFDESIYIPFLEHWTERDFESKCYAWQVPETFIIKSRLKGWQKNTQKDNPKKQKNPWI